MLPYIEKKSIDQSVNQLNILTKKLHHVRKCEKITVQRPINAVIIKYLENKKMCLKIRGRFPYSMAKTGGN